MEDLCRFCAGGGSEVEVRVVCEEVQSTGGGGGEGGTEVEAVEADLCCKPMYTSLARSH